MSVSLSLGAKTKNKLVAMAFALPVFFAIITLSLNIWQSNKGFVMSDEGWAAFLLKFMPQIGITQYYMYFKNVFQGNIYAIRLTTVFMELLGSFMFSYGLFSFYKERLNLTLKGFFVIFSFSIFSMFGVLSNWIYYVSMTKFALFMATGFILCGFAIDKQWKKNICNILSGLFLGTLFFIMPTTTPVILSTAILLFFISERPVRLTNVSLLVSGVFISILIYFAFFESFSVYVEGFKKAVMITVNDQFDDNHGLAGLFKWSKQTFLFFVYNILIGALALYGIKFLLEYKKTLATTILFSLYCIMLLIIFMMRGPHGSSSTIPVFVIYLYLFLSKCTYNMRKHQFNEMCILAYIFTIPVFGSLGTDIVFEARAIAYISFLLPVIYIMILEVEKKYKYIYYVLFLLLCATFFIHNLTGYARTNWGNIVYTKQTHSIQPITNQHLFLDKEKYNTLEMMRTLISADDHVIINSVELWGYAYLLETKPVSFNWVFNEEKVLQAIEENKKEIQFLKCICFNDNVFDPDFLENVKSKITAHTIVKHELSSITVYICQ